LLAEGENILSIIDHATTLGNEEVALSFTRSVMRYLDSKGYWHELLKYSERLRMIAESLNAKTIWAWICTQLTWLYSDQGRTEEAETLIRHSISLYQELGDLKGEVFAMNYLGYVFIEAQRYESAKEILNKAISLAQKHNDGDGIAFANYELANVARDCKEWENAKKYYELTINWCEEHEDEADLDMSFLMGARGNLGWVQFHLGNYPQGKELIKRSLTFFERMGGNGYTAILYLRLSAIEKALGNQEKAFDQLQKATFWIERLNMKRYIQEAQELRYELERDR
jgi:tetratricopeptide (TPR) repeat protein